MIPFVQHNSRAQRSTSNTQPSKDHCVAFKVMISNFSHPQTPPSMEIPAMPRWRDTQLHRHRHRVLFSSRILCSQSMATPRHPNPTLPLTFKYLQRTSFATLPFVNLPRPKVPTPMFLPSVLARMVMGQTAAFHMKQKGAYSGIVQADGMSALASWPSL
jgi:hypothetical protein